MAFYKDSEFEPDCSVGYLAKRVHLLGLRGLEPIFASEGVTAMQWSALVAIHFGRSSTAADIARDLNYDKGATTRLVDGLEANAWIVRERDTDDRRIVKLVLTPAGQDLAARVRSRVVDCWNDWLGDWDHDDIDAAIRLLQRLRDTLKGAVEQGGCA